MTHLENAHGGCALTLATEHQGHGQVVGVDVRAVVLEQVLVPLGHEHLCRGHHAPRVEAAPLGAHVPPQLNARDANHDPRRPTRPLPPLAKGQGLAGVARDGVEAADGLYALRTNEGPEVATTIAAASVGEATPRQAYAKDSSRGRVGRTVGAQRPRGAASRAARAA